MRELRFSSIAEKGDGLKPIFLKEFGIQAVQEGRDLVVKRPDAIKLRPILKLSPRLSLTTETLRQVGHAMVSQLTRPTDEDFKIPEKIKLTRDFGTLTEIDRVSSLAMVMSDSDIEDFVVSDLLPVMISKLSAAYVTGATCDVAYQQAWISVSKICFLADKVGVDRAGTLVKDRNAFGSALLNGADPLTFLDAFTRFSPIALTLPVRRRLYNSWHFQCEGFWNFSSALTHTFLNQFTLALSPLSAESHHIGLPGIKMGETQVWQFLRTAVSAINNLMTYANDPRNFADENGVVDFFKKLQTYTAINFIFADLSALNFSTTAHNRVSFGMTIMDRLANARVSLGGQTKSESQQMAFLASMSQCAEAESVLKLKISELYPELGETLIAVLNQSYKDLHTHLAGQSVNEDKSELSRLERLRLQRNLRHGAFLDRREKFEKLFLESDGTVPNSLASMAYLLVLAFALDPARFVAFSPVIQ
ncbi:MAG: hypothetical protein ACK4NA_04030 [Alphaproteobacteria bacterium]